MDDPRKMWNEKFSDKKDYVYEPIAFIRNNLSRLKKSRLLDLACGYGKNSVFLAESGFEVMAVDISDKALRIFRDEIIARGLKIGIVQAEVREFIGTLRPGTFDSVLISRFKPDDLIIAEIYEVLKPGGIFMLVSLNLKHREVNSQPFPEECYLKEKEFIDPHPGLKIELYEEFVFQGGYYNGYIFRKTQ